MNGANFQKAHRHSGLEAGALSRLRSHDMRRGSDKDTTQLPRIVGVATGGVALALGRSVGSHRQGVMARYVDSLADGAWTTANAFFPALRITTSERRIKLTEPTTSPRILTMPAYSSAAAMTINARFTCSRTQG
jgi:hypothetical protein